MCHGTHEIFLNLLERGCEEDDRKRRNGGPFVGGGDTGNLLNASGEKEEKVRVFRELL